MYDTELKNLVAYGEAHPGTFRAKLSERLLTMIEGGQSPFDSVLLLENELADLSFTSGNARIYGLEVQDALEELRELVMYV